MRPHLRLGLLLLLLLTVGSRILRPTPPTARAAARVPLPDLFLQAACGPAASQPVLICTITVTNVGTAALVTTQADPVNLALSLAVSGTQTTTVQAGLSSLCPDNSATLVQVGTDNLAAVTQNGSQNTLTITQTGTNNFAVVNQRGSVNVLTLMQTSTATSSSQETVQVSCGGATFAVGQSLSFTVSVGACSQPGGAALALSAVVSPPSGVTELTGGTNSVSGTFATPSCLTSAPPGFPPTPATVTLAASPTTAATGQPVTFTASVGCSSGIPTGTVTFASNGTMLATVPVTNGTATATLPLPSAGPFPVVATYNGDPFCLTNASGAASVLGTAANAPAVYLLNIPVTGCGTTTPANYPVLALQNVSITAVPCPGSVFVSWTGGPCDGKTLNPCSIPAGVQATANFKP